MTNLEKYINAYVEAFEVDAKDVPTLKYQTIDAWDSVGHMGLVAALEEAFDIMMEIDDLVDMSSFDIGKEMLSQKYEVDFNQ